MTAFSVALIPAYRPDQTMIDILKQLHQEGLHSVIVDDGSGSDYHALFEQAAFYGTVLRHDRNRGKGAALKTGLGYIQKRFEKNTVIVTMDADGQHKVDDAIRLCQAARWHPDALILGSRRLQTAAPLRSRFGNCVTRGVYRLCTGCNVQDTQTGLRAFSAGQIPLLLNIAGDRYEYEMRVLLEFSRRKIPILEVPIETVYLDHNASSHFRAVRDSYRIYKEILKFSASSMLGFAVDYGLYGLLLLMTEGNVLISNVGARIVSSITNYTVNRKFVFHSRKKVLASAAQYFLLAALLLCGNTLVLELLVTQCGLHRMLAKILVEMIFFLVSWTI